MSPPLLTTRPWVRHLMRLLADPTTVLAVSVFLTFTGFTLILPVVPFLIGRYVPEAAVALQSGLLVSVYGACLFLASPVLGACSDRFGRRPVLLACLLGSAIGYLVTGIGGALWVLFAGRIVDGLTAGSLGAIFAAVADVTPASQRGRVYGLLGAVGGIGFMVGPVLGGLLGSLSPEAPLFFASLLAVLNLIWVRCAVPETLRPEARTGALSLACLNPVALLGRALAIAPVRRALLPAFLFWLAAAMMQTTVALLLRDRFGYGPLGVGALLCLVGVMDIVSQGVLTRRLAPRMPATTLAGRGLAVNAAGFVAIACAALTPLPALLYAAVTVFTLGDGLFQPAISGLVADAAPEGAQGLVQGAQQSQRSIAQMTGPLVGAALYALDPSLPYWAGAGLVLAAWLSLGRPTRTRTGEAA